MRNIDNMAPACYTFHILTNGLFMPTPRNSDEEGEWDEDEGYVDLEEFLKRLDLTEQLKQANEEE